AAAEASASAVAVFGDPGALLLHWSPACWARTGAINGESADRRRQHSRELPAFRQRRPRFTSGSRIRHAPARAPLLIVEHGSAAGCCRSLASPVLTPPRSARPGVGAVAGGRSREAGGMSRRSADEPNEGIPQSNEELAAMLREQIEEDARSKERQEAR